jgi:hypothetical protein
MSMRSSLPHQGCRLQKRKLVPEVDPGLDVTRGYIAALYTDVPRGNTGYCAYHSSGSCGGVPVQFGFFFKLDGDPGCDPQDTSGPTLRDSQLRRVPRRSSRAVRWRKASIASISAAQPRPVSTISTGATLWL